MRRVKLIERRFARVKGINECGGAVPLCPGGRADWPSGEDNGRVKSGCGIYTEEIT